MLHRVGRQVPLPAEPLTNVQRDLHVHPIEDYAKK